MKAQIFLLVLVIAAAAAYWVLRDAQPAIVELSSSAPLPVVVDDNGPLYFTTPEAAVTEAAKMMRDKAWRVLARYYDLSGTDIPRATLDSGVFFMVKVPDQPLPPPLAELGQREPFVPGFQFINTEPDKEPGVTIVHVGMEIDQGGGPKQKVRSQFRLRKHEQGWQLLPPTTTKAP
ncbi:MAG: hypothetical protein HS117_05860 [Verrucomicrobiaceae bacterium]|jgi:hypothetical protein|nr:hypothetical protein [Verrucomicrobiaceae bacterium]